MVRRSNDALVVGSRLGLLRHQLLLADDTGFPEHGEAHEQAITTRNLRQFVPKSAHQSQATTDGL